MRGPGLWRVMLISFSFRDSSGIRKRLAVRADPATVVGSASTRVPGRFASPYFVARSPAMLNVHKVRLALRFLAPRLARNLARYSPGLTATGGRLRTSGKVLEDEGHGLRGRHRQGRRDRLRHPCREPRLQPLLGHRQPHDPLELLGGARPRRPADALDASR